VALGPPKRHPWAALAWISGKGFVSNRNEKMAGGVSDGFANLGPSFAAETAALSG
jgi:hypothetical protein